MEIAPGTKINQKQLAIELNVSRTPLVKALHKLETQGLVDNVPNKGFFVHQLTVQELRDLWILREALELIIITELVETIEPSQIQALEDIFKSFEQEQNENEIQESEYRQADRKFHSLLLSFCSNELVQKVDQHFQILSRALIAGLLRKPEKTLPEHIDITSALKSRDLESAKRNIVIHLEKSKKVLEETVSRLKALGLDAGKILVEEIKSEP